MCDAKIVLNTMTWYKAGAHDRIFNGMLAGACVVTDDSAYLRQQFENEQKLVRFRLEEIGHLPELIWKLLDHPDEMQQIADAGYQAAREGHTWKSRMQEIFSVLEGQNADFDL